MRYRPDDLGAAADDPLALLPAASSSHWPCRARPTRWRSRRGCWQASTAAHARASRRGPPARSGRRARRRRTGRLRRSRQRRALVGPQGGSSTRPAGRRRQPRSWPTRAPTSSSRIATATRSTAQRRPRRRQLRRPRPAGRGDPRRARQPCHGGERDGRPATTTACSSRGCVTDPERQPVRGRLRRARAWWWPPP